MASSVNATSEWANMITFDNRLELDLQMPSEKAPRLELDFHSATETNTRDSRRPSVVSSDAYLSTLISSPTQATASKSTCSATEDCGCYKCQRQRRRTGPKAVRNAALAAHTTASITSNPTQTQSSVGPISTSPSTSIRPLAKQGKPTTQAHTEPLVKHSLSEHIPSERTKDDYQISWKDDHTGDDILPSLQTFQSIFSAQPENDPAGLSDLIETRAKQLKEKTLPPVASPVQYEPTQPSPRTACCTLSYRTGAPHRPLTLYHTMKMQAGHERMNAYNQAFTHCTVADSGLSGWLQKQLAKMQPALMQTYITYRKKPTKQSILKPILPGKKQKDMPSFKTYPQPLYGRGITAENRATTLTDIPRPIPRTIYSSNEQRHQMRLMQNEKTATLSKGAIASTRTKENP